MRRKDKNLLALAKKKKRLAPPFQSKVEGGNARRRADMKRQAGGDVLPREPLPRREVLPREPLSSVRRKPKPGESREPPPLTGPTEGLKTGGDVGHLKDGGQWIGKARASMERRGTVGSLRKAMGVKGDATIPTGRLEAKKAQAKRTGNTAMMRKVNFALNVRK